MKTYEFTRDLTCGMPDGMNKMFNAGDTVGEKCLEKGTFESCLRQGYLIEFTPQSVEFAEPAVAPVVAPETKPVKPKGK